MEITMPESNSPQRIHPTAIIDVGAQLAPDVTVGAYAYIGGHVTIGPGCVVSHHACIDGDTTVGSGNKFFPFCTIGSIPQDLKYRGGRCRLEIGDNNTFREYSSAHVGTEMGGGITRVGSENLFMAGVHIAHDCVVDNHCILANNVLLAGHCHLADWAVVSGGTALTHFVSVGRHAFIGGVLGIVHDVPPYSMYGGEPPAVRGINRVGLKRRGFSTQILNDLKEVYRTVYCRDLPAAVGIRQARDKYPNSAEVTEMLDFIERSARGKSGRYLESLRSSNTPGSAGSQGKQGEDE